MLAGSYSWEARGAQERNAGNENTNNFGVKPSENVWEKDSQIMVGIDIGSTQSGVAFTFLQKGVKRTVHRVVHWPGQALDLQSKIPTLVWYDKHGKPMLFGAEAVTEEARESADEHKWSLAKRFKLLLHPKEMREKFAIKVDPLPNGVTLPQIYADFMKYLIKHTEPYFKNRIVDGSMIWEAYKDKTIFVIGHPNGWSLREQEFLRKAAIKGGLVDTADAKRRVRFVTEAEASVHYCIENSNISSRLQSGFNFAVCDAGGSTVDTAVYTVTATEPFLKLAEKREAACVQAGGLAVDDALEEHLETTLTRAGMDTKKIKECLREGIDDFEVFPKRQFLDDSDSLRVKLGDKNLMNPEFNIRRGTITISSPIPKQCFDRSVKPIMRSVDDQIIGASVSHILLVGGFGDSPYLQRQLKDRYEPLGSELTIVNDSRSKAVAEGAILWNTMTSVFKRAPKWSYGIQGYVRVDSHSSEHRERNTFTTPDGYEKVTGVWCEIVKKGVALDADHICRQSFFRTYSSANPNLENIEIALYSYSGNDRPKWLRSSGGSLLKGFDNVCLITADLRSLSGALEAKIGPRGTYWGLLFWVCVRFGDTEISAYLEWEEDGETCFGPIFIIAQDVKWV
ncbi:Heat shock 70 kDa protein 12B OS=Homo sapiens GN=HSPA12B PE=2 SV=2 [Rhizoctonia solani AG-1 IB]|uniref:Heat shock 70 kDa protein 12B n=1 Tax=Thanatephorus cucumeris (strain AG1-IB / isolate 7/3/14) TaxID=1108050 RepID=A0A0B7FDF2_THACB|nr:Heat shock 70 kDa protein 12B OS=Homo sapiens GN=HSPA12B PE=2 SV=2 [Rhizoctonia solani AG-1 IB]